MASSRGPKLPAPSEDEVERLAREISLQVWRRIRRMIAKQQRELHDLEEIFDDE